jgi:hypothetical protein
MGEPLTKTQNERLWYLNDTWGRFPGWAMSSRRGAKWDAHRRALIKDGSLEVSPDGSMCRITEKGQSALIEWIPYA